MITVGVDLVEKYPLRAYDSVQLAAALEVNKKYPTSSIPALSPPSLTFVSADGELNKIAQAEALTVENPNNY